MWRWLPSRFVPRCCSWRWQFLDNKGAPRQRATGHAGSRDVDRVGLRQRRDLVAANRRFVDGWNQRRQPFVWVKTPTTS